MSSLNLLVGGLTTIGTIVATNELRKKKLPYWEIFLIIILVSGLLGAALDYLSFFGGLPVGTFNALVLPLLAAVSYAICKKVGMI